MDIRKFSVEETTLLHLRDTNDELMYADGDTKKPMTVTVFGPGSKAYAKAASKNQNRMIDKLKKKGKTEQTAEAKALENAEFLTDCTKGMENIDYDKLAGEDLYRAIYADTSIGFIAEQVGKHIGDWANFTKASAKT